mmetsp:Transcript_56006/g.123021  ORF Transcript_56006/g.123021 Transcript_56006/m.123021 type:complete len:237 (+) Transcript_56006:447-1157(+)
MPCELLFLCRTTISLHLVGNSLMLCKILHLITELLHLAANIVHLANDTLFLFRQPLIELMNVSCEFLHFNHEPACHWLHNLFRCLLHMVSNAVQSCLLMRNLPLNALYFILHRQEMLRTYSLMGLGEPLHKLSSRELATPIHIQHVEQFKKFLDPNVDAVLQKHLYRLIFPEPFDELLLINHPAPISVSVSETVLKEVGEVQHKLLLPSQMEFLRVSCSGNHVVRDHRCEERNHHP